MTAASHLKSRVIGSSKGGVVFKVEGTVCTKPPRKGTFSSVPEKRGG